MGRGGDTMNRHRHEPPRKALSRAIRSLSRQRFLTLTGRLAAALAFGRLPRERRAMEPARVPAGAGPAQQAGRLLAQLMGPRPPFAFSYGGRSSAALLARWPR